MPGLSSFYEFCSLPMQSSLPIGIAMANILAFYGDIVRREKTMSRDRVRLPSMSLVNCLHWCITHLSCVGIDFRRDSKECWYTSFTSETINSDKRNDHYVVERKCLEVTTGKYNADAFDGPHTLGAIK